MASRTGAGTGVIVALVVFVLTTLCLLFLTIVFYSGKTEADDKAFQANAELNRFASPAERGSDAIKAIEGAAGPNQSVVGQLQKQIGELSAMVSGNPGASLAQIRADLGLSDTDVLRNVVSELRRNVGTKANEATSAQNKIAAISKELESASATIAQLQKQNEEVVGGIDGTIDGYAAAVRDAESKYRENVDVAQGSLGQLESDWRGRFDELQKQADTLRADNALMGERVKQLQTVVDAIRIKPKNPAELVDGRIVDIGSDNEVFINIGAVDRVVLGTTFEVYEDENAIQVDPRTGQELRGKGSIQVIKVGDKSSTARVTRATPGRPIVKNNVIANAVYDPKHRFRFLVHGKFDVNDDGRPTAAGADFVRSKVVEWGGETVDGDELTGDLDFLVLGAQPPIPPPLPPNAEVARFNAYIEMKAARDLYDRLFKQAREAGIPVLNWNRFQVLTGTTQR